MAKGHLLALFGALAPFNCSAKYFNKTHKVVSLKIHINLVPIPVTRNKHEMFPFFLLN